MAKKLGFGCFILFYFRNSFRHWVYFWKTAIVSNQACKLKLKKLFQNMV